MTDLTALKALIKEDKSIPNRMTSAVEEQLRKKVPNYATSIRDPKNWDAIDDIIPQTGYENLCEIFVTVCGLELAEKWFDSRKAGQKWAAESWFFDNVSTSLWAKFDSDMKYELLHRLFDRWSDEPLEKIDQTIAISRHKLRHINKGYIPSSQVEKIRNIIQKANDKTYIELMNWMVAQHAYENIPSQTPYSPNMNERELIARLMDITGRSGYSLTALPPILISSETPPIFVAYPELEDDENKNERGEDQIPRNRERRRPETISIEELLGVYQPRHQQIIIYERGIRWRRHRLDEEWLFAVVLIHELGHWITHMLPKPGMPTWATDMYVLGEMDVHEGWAQLMTYWIANQVGGKFKRTFEDLNKNQSPPYRVFEQFKNEPIDKVMASLEKLRLLSWPARLQDWKKAIG